MEKRTIKGVDHYVYEDYQEFKNEAWFHKSLGNQFKMDIYMSDSESSDSDNESVRLYNNRTKKWTVIMKLRNFDINKISIVFDFNLWKQHMGYNLLAELKKIYWICTINFYAGELLLNYFTTVIDNDDDYISYSGGCAQNVVWNTTLKNKFKNLIIPPHCSDEGLSLGVIEFFRRKYNLPFFKLNNFPFSQGGK